MVDRELAGPILLCYDGSEHAENAVRCAAGLFGPRDTLVVTVWQPAAGSMVLAGPITPVFTTPEIDEATIAGARQLAQAGTDIANAGGLRATPLVVEADEAVWKTIVEVADKRDAAVIVVGSRGLTGVRSALVGSVSNAVLHHTRRPTLIIHLPETHKI